MADDAIRLKVDRSLYYQTLSSLDTQLGNLKSHEENLQNQINRLNSGNVFAGSDVKAAIKKAEESLEAVRDGISRVTGYRVAIQQQLEGVESAKETLASDMSSIDIPKMFD
jgi:chromosome segregation ATPase